MHFNDNCRTCDTVKLLLVFKKSTKQTKSILATNIFKIFAIDLFLNTLNLPIPLNFIHPKVRITNLDEHTFLCICGLFADRDVKPFSQIDI